MKTVILTQKLPAWIVISAYFLGFFPNLCFGQAIAYPDMQVQTPINSFSIGKPTSSTREFRFSHITWNSGDGPLEIRPNYNPSTNVSQGYQRLYTRNASGGLTFVKDAPIAMPMYWKPPSDYQFPMSSFALYSDLSGSIGTVVATSPKVNFCMTADVAVNLKLPFAPGSTAYSPVDCTDPNGILGLSIGWGDQYDYTDPGENIDITSLSDGIYWLRSVADPYHLFQDKNPANNCTDTQVQITGTTVKFLQQLFPDSTPPAVTLASPGSSVSGPVVLTATVTPVAGTTIQSKNVQFLVDGQAVSGNLTANPPQYSITWNASISGAHVLSAQATASNGFIGTSPPIPATVPTQIGSFVTDQTLSASGLSAITTNAFSVPANELLLAFVGSDGPAPSNSQTVTVSGGGLSWALVQRGNTQSGDAEIWSASATSSVSNLAVTSSPVASGYNQSLTVVALHSTGGVAGIGAHSSTGSSQGGGASSVSLTTIAPGSWVIGVGSDYDQAIAPTLGPNQQVINQQLFAASGVTFWVQATTGITPSSGTLVTLNDTAPVGDQWNFSSVEIVASGARQPPPDTTPPVISIGTPSSGATVSGIVPVSANATDNVALSANNPVVFALNGATLPGQVTMNGSLFSLNWDSTSSANGAQALRATATDTSGNTAVASVNVTVSNPPPTTTCFIVDSTTSVHGRGPVTTANFSDALPGELLVAFAGSDGPNSVGSQTLTVSGGGLTWKLVKRANAQAGTAEVWTAPAPATARLTNARITAKQSKTGYDMNLYVIAVQGTAGVGSSATASAGSGAPTVTLTTTKAGSLIYATGNDWDNAQARASDVNQILDNQWLDSATGDTYWTQNQTYPPSLRLGAVVTLNDTSPTNDRWNFVSVELMAED